MKTGDALRKKAPARKKTAPGVKVREWAPFLLFNQLVLEVGVCPSNRSAMERIGVVKKSETVSAPKEAAPESASDTDEAEEQITAPETAATVSDAAAETMCIRITTGRTHQDLDFDEADYQAYEAQVAELEAARGIYILGFEKESATGRFPRKNVYYLKPRAEGDGALQAYKVLHRALQNEGKGWAAIGYFIHGKGIDAIAVTADDDGLVMSQVPRPGESHSITDAIPTDWRAVRIDEDDVAELGKVIRRHVGTFALADLDDPRDVLLWRAAKKAKKNGQVPAKSSSKTYASLRALLEALP